MTAAELERWANQQIKVAIELGINPLDAANAAKAFLALLPPGADPNTYIVPAWQLEQNLTAPEIIADARAAFYASEDIPAQFKRILDAGSTDGQL